MCDKPLWRHEMELPMFDDFDNEQDFEQAMNMWVHDKLYGLDDDRSAFEKQQEYELRLLYDNDWDNIRVCTVCGDRECVAPATKCHACRTQEMIDND